jgi:hypothetical protein
VEFVVGNVCVKCSLAALRRIYGHVKPRRVRLSIRKASERAASRVLAAINVIVGIRNSLSYLIIPDNPDYCKRAEKAQCDEFRKKCRAMGIYVKRTSYDVLLHLQFTSQPVGPATPFSRNIVPLYSTSSLFMTLCEPIPRLKMQDPFCNMSRLAARIQETLSV